MTAVRNAVVAIGGGLEEVFELLRKRRTGTVTLFRDGQPAVGTSPGADAYGKLRLDGETLLVVQVGDDKLEEVVSTLRKDTQPAVFVIAGELREPAPERPEPSLKNRIRTAEGQIAATYHELREAAVLGHLVSPAAQWLLENAHSLRSHLSGIRESLRGGLLKNVPSDPAGAPRVLGLAESILADAECTVSEERILGEIRRYQRETILQISEIWLLPTMLRLALVESLARHGVTVTAAQHLREAAYFWANRLAAANRVGGEAFQRVLERLVEDSLSAHPYFLVAVAEQLQEEDRALAPLRQWIESRAGESLDGLARKEHQTEAAQGVAIANAFGSLRVLSSVDFLRVFDEASLAEQELNRDAVYAGSDLETRNQARRALQTIALESGKAEVDVAREAMALASKSEAGRDHVLYFLIDEGRPSLERATGARPSWKMRATRAVRSRSSAIYLGSVACLTLAFSFLALGVTMELRVNQGPILPLLWILTLFPLSELAAQIVNVLVISFFPPSSLPKRDFRRGIPAAHATLVVVPMMLTSREVAAQEVEKLEVRYLANPGENVSFSLFSDFLDAPRREMPEDAGLLAEVRGGIERLNAKYPGERFLLFHRAREWSPTENCWIGRERKRGKLGDLNAYLLGKGDPSIRVAGRLPLPVRYVIALDADTQLPPDSARRLIETIAHPLNQPVLDPVTKVRRRGFAIVQPRVSITLPGATATRFTRITGDPHGTDPYSRLVSDAQQDLFGHAIFHGKAIYDLHAFAESLEGRFPGESILSHDLIEGAHCGVGLATDIELFETMPLDYASYSKRQHRWIRGDWQIAPWILPTVPTGSSHRVPNPLSSINRWRVFDNLRRSLVPAVSVAMLLLGWFVSATPAVWTLVLALAIVIPALALVFDRLALRLQGSVSGARDSYDELARAMVSVFFLPHQAWLAVDAVIRAVYRMTVSRRNLLEWQTAETAGLSASLHMSAAARQLAVISALSCGVAIWQAWMGHYSALPFLGLWIASPFVMRWLAVRADNRGSDALDRAGRTVLRTLARQTWRYFDDLVGEDTNWLPPDNTQLALRVEIAGRTSPTNIGLWLNSALAAWDFGYIGSDDLRRRCLGTMNTLDRMERYEGHLLNWYDIASLQPLTPRYVSTVDSGNLIACLWILERGCHEMLREQPVSPRLWRGLADTFENLRQTAMRESSLTFELRALRRLLRREPEPAEFTNKARLAATLAGKIRNGLAGADEETRYWADKLHAEANACVAAAGRYWPWMETLARQSDSNLRQLGSRWLELRSEALEWQPSLEELAGAGSPVAALLDMRDQANIDPHAARWLDDLNAEFTRSRRHAAQAAGEWRELAARLNRFAAAIDMGFLYDRKRKLFGIGYAVGGPVEFSSHYDLLASECRIASLAAIAKGDVPLEHWFMLGRPRTPSPSGQTLLSWSGTMFEYLMPVLFARSYPNSLLAHACKDAVARQIDFGRAAQLPWGVSESAYSALDSRGTYQYHAFGVPDLSLRGIPEGECVVAPYATALALQVDPAAALENFEKLRGMGLAGPMGFYEAIDFSRQQSPAGERGVVIYAYMSHHQGMTLLALDNVLNGEPMQNRFHSDLRVRAIESLLFERIPDVPVTEAEKPPEPVAQPAPSVESASDRAWTHNTAVPRVQLLGNGRYSVMVTNGGAGYSRWKEFDISRWRSDPTCDQWGSYLFLRDVKEGTVWPASHRPLAGEPEVYSAHFSADHADFHRLTMDVESNLQVAVAAEDDVELRRLVLTNWSPRRRFLDVTSYFEIALAPHGADKAHPAFSKMFVQTEYLGNGLLIATRRKRSPEEPSVWVAHMLVGAEGAIGYETDREVFLGRGNTIETADALGRQLTDSVGTVVDPVFSLRCRIDLEPRHRQEISFVTAAAATREQLLALVEQYRRPEAIPRLLEMVWNRAQLDFRYLRIGPEDAHRFQHLASALLYPDPVHRAPADRLTRSRAGQSGLWAAGISGDLPILATAAGDARALGLIRELLLAHRYLRMRGLQFDLVILNQEGASYDRPVHQQIRYLVQAHAAEAGTDRPGGVFVRDWNTLAEDTVNQILAAASVSMRGSRGSLRQQLGASSESVPVPRAAFAGGGAEEPSRPLPFLELPYFNGLGGFTKDGREYAIYLRPGSQTPAPWANVMAHAAFGTLVTESGLGFTWAGNSQANRLTPWHNDPVSDPQSEALFLRDEESGAVWTPTPLPVREQDAYRARHGQGYTVFEHNSHAIGQLLTVFVPVGADGTGDNVKVCRLELRNDSSRTRRLSATYFAELVLGSQREDQQLHIATAYDAASKAVFARQWWNRARAGHVAFLTSTPGPSSFTGDRAQFLGRNHTILRPDALGRARLDNRTGAGLDPAAAVQVHVSIPAGATVEVTFLLGQCETEEESRALISKLRQPGAVERSLAGTRAWWDSVLGVIEVRTPVLSVNLLLNRWLLYQSLSCRYWGRSALYQSGGAIGFRDQLQDSLAFLYTRPDFTRRHLLLAASRQFEEGDVQHWWHRDTGLGVRTRCSDDLLWLPFAAAHYVQVTGDLSVLNEPVSYLTAPELTAGEHEKMFIPQEAVPSGSLLEHCLRAIERASTSGPHRLPLIGNGDWNDGMNHVGVEGKGESVWVAWFLCAVRTRFADVLDLTGDGAGASRLRAQAASTAAAVEQTCWDGDWYLRAFFDNGEAMGSHRNKEAIIDSLPQSWSVISGAGDPDRARHAVETATAMLADPERKLVRLFTPPFDTSTPHPGYIMGYPPGLRENGGQYTHGSLWLAMAWARLGDGDQAARLLNLMNPVEQSRTAADVDRYCGEPYVVAADVSAAPQRSGRSGWTWYTGSAAWMYRIWIEEVLGIRVRAGVLTVHPVCPAGWAGFDVTYRFGRSSYEISVQFEDATTEPRVEGDFTPARDGILLVDDGAVHHIRIAVPVTRKTTAAEQFA